MIALTVVTVVAPIFIGGKVHLILHPLDGYMRRELHIVLILESSPVIIRLEDYFLAEALRIGLFSIHDLLDARDRWELVLVGDLFLGGFERQRVLGGFYALGESSNSHAH